jgi:hypothetical protein
MNSDKHSSGAELHGQDRDGVEPMANRSSLAAAMWRRRSRGDISQAEYDLFRREWESQAALSQHIQLIDEVAHQMVDEEDARQARRTSPETGTPESTPSQK